jgi:hypothetical protein
MKEVENSEAAQIVNLLFAFNFLLQDYYNNILLYIK